MKYNKPKMEVFELELNMEVITSSLEIGDEKDDENTVEFKPIGTN